MKTIALALLCSLVCTACSKPLKTLSDGRPGYVITCDKVQTRCIDEITRLCRGKSFIIVTERAQEINPAGVLEGVHRAYNNLYWMEARCDQF